MLSDIAPNVGSDHGNLVLVIVQLSRSTRIDVTTNMYCEQVVPPFLGPGADASLDVLRSMQYNYTITSLSLRKKGSPFDRQQPLVPLPPMIFLCSTQYKYLLQVIVSFSRGTVVNVTQLQIACTCLPL